LKYEIQNKQIMEHLDFTDKLSDLGISYRGNIDNKEHIIHINTLFGRTHTIKIKDVNYPQTKDLWALDVE